MSMRGPICSYRDPRLADEPLDGDECLVAHIAILVSHELHDAGLAAVIGNRPITSREQTSTRGDSNAYFFPRS
jgi:hypothetical protein